MIGLLLIPLNDSDESGPPTLVVYDNNSLAIWASLRESKEITEDLVDWACCNLRDAAYTEVRITLKSDGEEGTQAFKGRVALKRKCETPLIQSPFRESKSNGAMEASIRSWKGAVQDAEIVSRTSDQRQGTVRPPFAWMAQRFVS